MLVFHYKEKNKDGVLESTPPKATIVAETTNGQTRFAASRCGSRDMFSRKIGRQIASGRLNSGKLISTVEGEVDTKQFVTIAHQLALQVIETKQVVQPEEELVEEMVEEMV